MSSVIMTTSLRVLVAACVLSSIICDAAKPPSAATIVGVLLNGVGCPPQSSVVIGPDGRTASITSPGRPAADTLGQNDMTSVIVEETCSLTLQLVTPQRWRSTTISVNIQGQMVAEGPDTLAAIELGRVEVALPRSRQGRLNSIVEPPFPLQTFSNVGSSSNFAPFDISADDTNLVCIVATKCSGLQISVKMVLTVFVLADVGAANRGGIQVNFLRFDLGSSDVFWL